LSSPKKWKAISEKSRSREVGDYNFYKKSTFITEARMTERYLFFVLEGIQAIYLMDKNGNQGAMDFTFDHEISGIYNSLITQTTSKYSLEVLAG